MVQGGRGTSSNRGKEERFRQECVEEYLHKLRGLGPTLAREKLERWGCRWITRRRSEGVWRNPGDGFESGCAEKRRTSEVDLSVRVSPDRVGLSRTPQVSH